MAFTTECITNRDVLSKWTPAHICPQAPKKTAPVNTILVRYMEDHKPPWLAAPSAVVSQK